MAKDVDRLYGLPLESFVSERGAAAKRLRADGDRAGAEIVAKLPKPSLAAWAINQLVRGEPELTHELLRAGGALREAQARALAGENGEALRDAAAGERRAVEALVEAARALRPAGRPPTTPTLDRIRATLHVAAADEVVRAEIRAGRLAKEAPAAPGWPAGPEGLLDLELGDELAELVGGEEAGVEPADEPGEGRAGRGGTTQDGEVEPTEENGDEPVGRARAKRAGGGEPGGRGRAERAGGEPAGRARSKRAASGAAASRAADKAAEKERAEARKRAEQQRRRGLERKLRDARTERQMKVRAVARAERAAGEAGERLQRALAAEQRAREDADAWKRRLEDARADAARSEDAVARLEAELDDAS